MGKELLLLFAVKRLSLLCESADLRIDQKLNFWNLQVLQALVEMDLELNEIFLHVVQPLHHGTSFLVRL